MVSSGVCTKVLSTAAQQAIRHDIHLHRSVPTEDELARGVKTSVSLDHSDHEVVMSQIPR